MSSWTFLLELPSRGTKTRTTRGDAKDLFIVYNRDGERLARKSFGKSIGFFLNNTIYGY